MKSSKVKDNATRSRAKSTTGFNSHSEKEENDVFPDYPIYPPNEDIYSNYTKEEEVDIEHPYQIKSTVDKHGLLKIKEVEDDLTGEGLDIPGAELDDEQEFIGSEDEENNYYSLGGENHENLDEDRGDNYQ